MGAHSTTRSSFLYAFLWLLVIAGCRQESSRSEDYISDEDRANSPLENATFDPVPATISTGSPEFHHTAHHGTYRVMVPNTFALSPPEKREWLEEGYGTIRITSYEAVWDYIASAYQQSQSWIPAVVVMSMAVTTYPKNWTEGMSDDEVLEVLLLSLVKGNPGLEVIHSRKVVAGTQVGLEADFRLHAKGLQPTAGKCRFFAFGDETVTLQVMGGGVVNPVEPEAVFADPVGKAFLEGFVYTPH